MFSSCYILPFFVFILSCHGYEYVKFQPEEISMHPPPPKPKWPDRYFVQGTLSLPYAELVEPFSAWIDAKVGQSRIDMYGGMTITIQRGDKGPFGQHFMIAPVTNEKVINRRTCFKVNGTKDGQMKYQSLLPDVSNFTYIGVKTMMGEDANVWQYKTEVGYKINTYTLYVAADSLNRPLFYEMYGYDSLIGSHYDDYKVQYNLMALTFMDSVFDTPMKGMYCHGFPGPGYEAKIVANPMAEYVHPVDDSHIEPMHEEFRRKYNKKRPRDHSERNKRKHIFKHNLRYINSMNRNNLTFSLKVNHLAEHSPEDLRHLRGRRTTPRAERVETNRKPFTSSVANSKVPESLNWRLYGAVTPVKDQATCGSCWSFGSTGTIEGTLFLKTGKLIRLSQQNLMDCSWGFGNNGCDGGEEFRSFQYIKKHGGLASEQDYGPYLGVDGFCHQVEKVVNITGYVNVPSGNVDALLAAITKVGPVAVGIDAAHLSLVFYSHGVFYEPKCGHAEKDLDHAVLAVGFGTMHGEPYWLIKNSWSTHWGNDGYVLVSRKDNNCGIATDASYVTMK